MNFYFFVRMSTCNLTSIIGIFLASTLFIVYIVFIVHMFVKILQWVFRKYDFNPSNKSINRVK